MARDNPTNVDAAFDILLEQIETEIDLVNRAAHGRLRAETMKLLGPRWNAPGSSSRSEIGRLRYVGNGRYLLAHG
jgi:hypothetical protein